MAWHNDSEDERAIQIVSPSPQQIRVIDAEEAGEVRFITCPSCGHNIELQNRAGIQDLPGLPAGVKFDPSDQEILEHLEAKVSSNAHKIHPLIDEFIPTIEGENGICYTHPEKLPDNSLERNTCRDADPLDIHEPEGIVPNEFPSWNWRGTPRRDEDVSVSGGRVISVKYEESVKRIGIDGSADAIKEAIKSAFRLRTKRSFWLEDEAGIIRALDRNMPLRNYTLHLDDGLRVRICLFEDSNHLHCRVIEKAFFNEDVFNSYLNNRGWIGLKELRSCRNVDSMNELRAGEVYHGRCRAPKI